MSAFELISMGMLIALIAFLLAALLGSSGGRGQRSVSSRPLPAPKTRTPPPPLTGRPDPTIPTERQP